MCRSRQIVAEAAALVRPGGWVAFHEADYVSHVCDPPSGAWTTLVDLLQTYSAKNGINPLIGRKVPGLLREAGLVDVRVNPIVHVYPPGHGRRNLLLDFAENLSERFVEQKLVGEQEFSGARPTSHGILPTRTRSSSRISTFSRGDVNQRADILKCFDRAEPGGHPVPTGDGLIDNPPSSNGRRPHDLVEEKQRGPASYTIRTRRPHGLCSAAENEIVDRDP